MKDKINVLTAKVIKNAPITKDIWLLTLDPGPDFDVTKLSPGQFVCLALETDSVMARPFSISTISTFNETFDILYRIVGKNTEQMRRLVKGQNIKFWGPLGKAEIIDPTHYDEVWLVGGGIGIAPLLFFEKVISEYQGHSTRVFYGGRNINEMMNLDLVTPEPVEIATEDGSVGFKGFITDLFSKKIIKRTEKILVIACGPNPMMKKMAEICEQYKVDCYVILEKIMACGIGVCLGCSIKTTKGMKRVCHDGPIFDAEEVIWNELG